VNFGKVTSKKVVVSHVVRLATTLLEEEEFTRQLEYGEKQLLLTGYIESTEQSRTAEHLIGCIFCQ